MSRPLLYRGRFITVSPVVVERAGYRGALLLYRASLDGIAMEGLCPTVRAARQAAFGQVDFILDKSFRPPRQ